MSHLYLRAGPRPQRSLWAASPPGTSAGSGSLAHCCTERSDNRSRLCSRHPASQQSDRISHRTQSSAGQHVEQLVLGCRGKKNIFSNRILKEVFLFFENHWIPSICIQLIHQVTWPRVENASATLSKQLQRLSF